MALLMDLPSARREALGTAWGVGSDAAAIYRAMTDPATLTARLAQLPVASAALALLARGPSAADDLVARLPYAEARLMSAIQELAALALVARAPVGGLRARLADGATAGELLYVPGDVAAVVTPRAAGARRA